MTGTAKILYNNFKKNIKFISLRFYKSINCSYIEIYRKGILSEEENNYSSEHKFLIGSNVINIPIKNCLSYPQFIALISIKLTDEMPLGYLESLYPFIETALSLDYKRRVYSNKIWPSPINLHREKPFFYDVLSEIRKTIPADIAYSILWYDRQKLKVVAELLGCMYLNKGIQKSPYVNLSFPMEPSVVEDFILETSNAKAIDLRVSTTKGKYAIENILIHHSKDIQIKSILIKSFFVEDKLSRKYFEGATYEHKPYVIKGFIILARSKFPPFLKMDAELLENYTKDLTAFIEYGLTLRREFNYLGYIDKSFIEEQNVSLIADKITNLIESSFRDRDYVKAYLCIKYQFVNPSEENKKVQDVLLKIIRSKKFGDIMGHSDEKIFFITNIEIALKESPKELTSIAERLLDMDIKSIFISQFGLDNYLIIINNKAHHFSFFDKFKYKLFSNIMMVALSLHNRGDIERKDRKDSLIFDNNFMVDEESTVNFFTDILKRAIEVTDSRYADIYLYNHQEKLLELKKSYKDDNHFKTLKLGEGTVGRCAEIKEPIHINDVNDNSNYIKLRQDTTAEIAIPIMYRNFLYAVLNVEKNFGNYSKADNVKLQNLVNSMLVAYQSYKLSYVFSTNINKLRNEIDNIIETESDRSKCYKEIALKIITAVLRQSQTFAHSAVIRLARVDERGLSLERIAYGGVNSEEKHGKIYFEDKKGVNLWVYKNKKSCYLHDVYDKDNYSKIYPGIEYLTVRNNTRSELCMPLRMGAEIMGTFNIESDQIGGLGQDLPYFLTLGDLASNCFEQIRSKHDYSILRQFESVITGGIYHDVKLNKLNFIIEELKAYINTYGLSNIDSLERILKKLNDVDSTLQLLKDKDIEVREKINIKELINDLLEKHELLNKNILSNENIDQPIL